MLKAKKSDWYKNGWDLNIKNAGWTENTVNEVDFIIKTLGLTGSERILDLACGYGRHSLEFAKRGYEVVGADITKCYVDDANKNAKKLGVNAKFIQSDIRDVSFENEFDVVLNLADGAIGYLENDEENEKIFDVVARALKKGGKHFCDIGNAEHAEHYFPTTHYDVGEKSLSLAEFDYNKDTHIMLFGGWDLPYGEPLIKPEICMGDPTRLYCTAELKEIYAKRNMQISDTFCDYTGKPASYKDYQLMVYAVKN